MGIWTGVAKGVRYKEHLNRKHGRRLDRYWCLQYKLHGRTVNEAVGWWSDGITQSQCEALMAELRVNQKSGQGPQTLREMRQFNKERREAEAKARKAAAHKNRTLAGFWEAEYYPKAALSHAAKGLSSQRGLLKNWLAPLADKHLKDISTSDLENLVMRPMMQAGRSPALIRHALILVSVVWNLAAEMGVVSGENPVANIKKPRRDDARDRFLSKDEAARLLTALKEASVDAHDVAVLSLFSGLRIGECLALTWADVNFEDGLIFVKDTKNKHNRHAYITAEIREMLTRRREDDPKSPVVFLKVKPGTAYAIIRTAFAETVKALGFNDGLADSRQKVVIHTLRHSFASWLVQMGTPLYTVSKLMGHRSLKMTERYAHLAPDTQKAAAMELEGILGGRGVQ